MFLMWVLGVNLGMRIGDLVQLRVGDMRGQYFYRFVPQKTKHTKRNPQPMTISVTKKIRDVMAARCAGMADEDWIFQSRKRTPGGNPKHISRQTALNDMKEIGRICGLGDFPMGCHTMRKTFGYQYYKATRDPAKLMAWFDHSSEAITKIYIGIADDELRAMTDKNPMGRMDGIEL